MGVGECFWGEFYRVNVGVGTGVGEVAGDGAGAGAEVDDERVGGVAKVGGDPVGELFGFGSGDEYSGSDGEGEGAVPRMCWRGSRWARRLMSSA